MLHVFLVWPLNLRLVLKKVFLKYWTVSILFVLSSSKKSSTASYKSSKNFFKIVRKGYQKKLISKMCRSLEFINREKKFTVNLIFRGLRKFCKSIFLEKKSLGTSWRKSSTHFWNQRKIPLLLIPFVPSFEEIFFNSYKGQCYFLEVKRSKKIKTLQYLKKRFFINLT